MNIQKHDIVVVEGKVLQYIGKRFNNGLVLQDIHCAMNRHHVNLPIRKATDEENKWFCEHTENIEFINPNNK